MSFPTNSHSGSSRSLEIRIHILLQQELMLQSLARGVSFARIESEDVFEKIQSFGDSLLVLLRSIVGTVVGVEVRVGGEDDVFEVVAGVVESGDVGDEGSI